jgi:hypothetical protein
LGGPDRRAEDGGKLTIFLDEVLDQCDRSHPSFQNDEEPDAGLIELFNSDTEFVNEVCAAFRTSFAGSRFRLHPIHSPAFYCSAPGWACGISQLLGTNRSRDRSNAVNLIENAGSSHEFHECHETLSLSVAPFLALFVYFVQFVAVLVLPKQEFPTLS